MEILEPYIIQKQSRSIRMKIGFRPSIYLDETSSSIYMTRTYVIYFLWTHFVHFELSSEYSIDLILIQKLIRIMFMENICQN